MPTLDMNELKSSLCECSPTERNLEIIVAENIEALGELSR